MSSDDRELYIGEWREGCQRQILFIILVVLITHSIAFVFGFLMSKIIYG